MDLHLLNQFPDTGMPGDFGDGGVKRLIGLMEAFAIPRSFGFPLPLQDRAQGQNLAGRGAFGR